VCLYDSNVLSFQRYAYYRPIPTHDKPESPGANDEKTAVMPLYCVPRNIYLGYRPVRLLLLCEISKGVVFVTVEHEWPLHQAVKVSRRGNHLADISSNFHESET
jgi:hypothetical protein